MTVEIRGAATWPPRRPPSRSRGSGCAALVNGEPPRVVSFVDAGRSPSWASPLGGRIVEIDILADPARLNELDLSPLDA